MNIKQLFIIFIISFSLQGCTGWNLESLKSAELSGSDYQKALAKEYLDFAQSEADSYDWVDSSYFAEKGLMVTYGNEVKPEDPALWKISENNISALIDGREKLLQILNDENKKDNPEITARILLLYDCWVEEQEENWQTEHINACRDEFFEKVNQLKNKSKEEAKPKVTPLIAPPPAPETEKKPESIKPVEAPKPKKSVTHQVYFGFDSAKLNKEAKNTIQKIAADKNKDEMITINIIASGHTDRVGKSPYNLKLSKRRAESVKKELARLGFSEKNISIYALGETDPAIPTKDGVKEPKNRRVEIIVKE